jgi:hypothetical protein
MGKYATSTGWGSFYQAPNLASERERPNLVFDKKHVNIIPLVRVSVLPFELPIGMHQPIVGVHGRE